jgi:hypothetical protein
MDLETGISFPRAKASVAERDAIRSRAYFLWESEGRPDGHRVANWLEAESELQSSPTARVGDIPSAPVEACPSEGSPYSPAHKKNSRVAIRKTDGPSPLCREAVGDDIRDYAFDLYIKSGCDAAQWEESWREAELCIEARVPIKAPTRAMPRPRWTSP